MLVQRKRRLDELHPGSYYIQDQRDSVSVWMRAYLSGFAHVPDRGRARARLGTTGDYPDLGGSKDEAEDFTALERFRKST